MNRTVFLQLYFHVYTILNLWELNCFTGCFHFVSLIWRSSSANFVFIKHFPHVGSKQKHKARWLFVSSAARCDWFWCVVWCACMCYVVPRCAPNRFSFLTRRLFIRFAIYNYTSVAVTSTTHFSQLEMLIAHNVHSYDRAREWDKDARSVGMFILPLFWNVVWNTYFYMYKHISMAMQ